MLTGGRCPEATFRIPYVCWLAYTLALHSARILSLSYLCVAHESSTRLGSAHRLPLLHASAVDRACVRPADAAHGAGVPQS